MQSVMKYTQDAFLSKKWQQMQVQIKSEANWDNYTCHWDSAEGK